MSHNTLLINNQEPNASGEFTVPTGSEFLRFCQGESSAYSGSGASAMTAGSNFYFYDSAPISTMSDVNIEPGWISSISLPVGRYQVTYQSHVVFSASGNFGIGLYNGGTLVSTPMVIGNVQASNNGVALLTVTSTTTFTFKISQSTNVSPVASQGNTPSEYGHIFILRVE